MKVIILTVDVNSEIPGSSYRVYAGDDLLTERAFPFENGIFIQEQITLCVEDGDYVIRVEPLQANGVSFKNLRILEGDDSVTISLA